MANRINTYQLFRVIHFYAAAITGVFLLLFFLTGFFIARYTWFDHENAEPVVQTHAVELPTVQTTRQLAQWVRKELGITGKVEWINALDNGDLEVEILNPREFHLVKVQVASGTLQHETRPHSAYETLSVLHRVHGYGGEMVYNIYLVAMDLASLSLLIFVITGVYLWLKVIKRKVLGWLFLGLGLGYTSWVIFTFVGG